MILSVVAFAFLGAGQDAPPEDAERDKPGWSVFAGVYAYFVPDDRDYLQPTIMADIAQLHLEARYNYEDRDTGSAWLGWNFSVGDDVKLEVTPMLGGVFGRTDGIAPGYRASLTWWRLDLSSEGEYVFSFHDSPGNFLYTWSELTLAPIDRLQIGAVVQRTRVYEADFDVQRGLLVRWGFKALEFTGAVFNPTHDPIFVAGIGIGF